MESERRDRGGIGMAVFFVVAGVFVLYDAATYKDLDSAVFPRTVAILMIVLSVVLAVRNLLRPAEAAEPQAARGSLPRRAGLVAIMIAASAAMPYVGMLLSALLAFGGLMVIAMFEPWTPRRLVVYPVSAVIMVAGFYVLFAEVLQVPLPTGTLFD